MQELKDILKNLKDKEEKLFSELEELQRKIKAFETALSFLEKSSSVESFKTLKPTRKRRKHTRKSSEICNAFKDDIVSVLESTRQPMRAVEIWEILKEKYRGVFNSSSVSSYLNASLLKKRRVWKYDNDKKPTTWSA